MFEDVEPLPENDAPDDEATPPGDDQIPGFDEPREDADESEAGGIVAP